MYFEKTNFCEVNHSKYRFAAIYFLLFSYTVGSKLLKYAQHILLTKCLFVISLNVKLGCFYVFTTSIALIFAQISKNKCSKNGLEKYCLFKVPQGIFTRNGKVVWKHEPNWPF